MVREVNKLPWKGNLLMPIVRGAVKNIYRMGGRFENYKLQNNSKFTLYQNNI